MKKEVVHLPYAYEEPEAQSQGHTNAEGLKQSLCPGLSHLLYPALEIKSNYWKLINVFVFALRLVA